MKLKFLGIKIFGSNFRIKYQFSIFLAFFLAFNLNTMAQTTVTVNGQVEATSIKINNWKLEAPDYVFASGYKLDSLSDLKTYIDKNKHLPGMPSALEIRTQGMDLTEMNFQLLRKVEELTLYMLAQEARIRELEEKQK